MENDQTMRFRKKIEKDENYVNTALKLCSVSLVQYNPPFPSRWSVGPGGQRDQEHGVVLHDQEEGYQPPILY